MEFPLKLLVNKEKTKVVFAEAEKDFVDVLFSFLTLPLGTIARLVGKEDLDTKPLKFGSLTSLYQSVANLDKRHLLETCKEMLQQPRNSMEAYCRNMKLNIDDTKPIRYYVCDNLLKCRKEDTVDASTFGNQRCRCGSLLSRLISPQSSEGHVFDGFVKSNVIFMITDDLQIVPLSLERMFSQLNNCGIENIPAMEEVNVNVTKKQVLDLLKCCLFSKTTLTNVFLEKKLVFEGNEHGSPLSDFALKPEGDSQIDVKLLQRKSNGEIVFAQGKEDFADFLYSFLTFPLGAVVHLLQGRSCIGSLDGLYHSIVDLSEDYFISNDVKDKLVFPAISPQFKLSNQIIPIHEFKLQRYFCFTKSTDSPYSYLYDCYLTSLRKESRNAFERCNVLGMVDPKSENGSANKGFVNGPMMYWATDDLVVKPFYSISVISLLNSKNIPLSDLEEKVIKIGINEGLHILKASMTSTSALTSGLTKFLTKVNSEK